jgi:hypothetical protein
MGVLLYALLCGYLPFDDDNINLLYKKIQNGKYEVPSWLSQDSIHLLNDLLQIDPKKRITMQQLVYHPWVLKGYSSGVDWQTRYYFKELDRECVAEIALYFNKNLKEVNDLIQMWYYDFLTATYFILLFMKMQGRQPKIKSTMKKYSQFITYTNVTNTNAQSNNIIASQQQINSNRVLVEKQLASLTISGNSNTTNFVNNTPKIMGQGVVSSQSPAIKDTTRQPNNNGNNLTGKPPVKYQNLENINPQPLTPLVKVSHAQVAYSNSTSSTQKPKQLFIDQTETTNLKQSSVGSTTKREGRSKTKTTTPNSKANQQQQQQIYNNMNNKNDLRKEPSPDGSSDVSSSTNTNSSSSSESLSVSSVNDNQNFVLPSRINKNKNTTTANSTATPKSNENVKVVSHTSRATSANVPSQSNSSNNNNDMIFIPPKTPVRSKTRETQYTTPSKLVSKSGKI